MKQTLSNGVTGAISPISHNLKRFYQSLSLL